MKTPPGHLLPSNFGFHMRFVAGRPFHLEITGRTSPNASAGARAPSHLMEESQQNRYHRHTHTRHTQEALLLIPRLNAEPVDDMLPDRQNSPREA